MAQPACSEFRGHRCRSRRSRSAVRAVVVTQCVVGGLGAAVALDLCVEYFGTRRRRASSTRSLRAARDRRPAPGRRARTTRGARRSTLFHAANAANSRLDARRAASSPTSRPSSLSHVVGSVLLGETPVILKGPALSLSLSPRGRQGRADSARRPTPSSRGRTTRERTVRALGSLYRLDGVFNRRLAGRARGAPAANRRSPARVIAASPSRCSSRSS